MRSGIISMLLILLFASCEHKDLCYSHPHDKEVRILFDWSNIHVDNIPKVVAVIFRNEETNTLQYLQPIITQYFIDNKSEIWLLFLIAHSKR